jgi:hypothetical protein
MSGRTTMPAIVACLVLAPLAAAAPEGEHPTVDDLVARHMAALGGVQRLRAVNSIRMTGTATAGSGRWARVTRIIQRPGRIRTEFTIQGITSVYAFDGTRGWYVAPLEGVLDPAPMGTDASLSAAAQAGIGGPLVDAVDKGHRIDLAGRERIDGREVYQITVTPPAGPKRTLYLDAGSALLVRTTSTRPGPDGTPAQLENDLGDYRETGGIAFPHFIRSRVRGGPDVIEIAVSEVELDPPLDPAEFKPPQND